MARLDVQVVDVGPPADWVKINVRETVSSSQKIIYAFYFSHVICNDFMQTEWFLWGLCTGLWAFTGGSIIPIMLLVSIKCIQFVFIFLHHLKALNKHRYGFNLIQLVAWSLLVSQNNLTIFGVLLPSRRYTHTLLFISLILTYSGKEKLSCRKLDIS